MPLPAADNQEFQPEIRHTTFIKAPVSRVYQALTTADGLDTWFTRGSSVDARPGGSIKFVWVDWGPGHLNSQDGGPVLEAVPERRFVFQWHPDEPGYTTTVEMDFAPDEGGTIISLRESGYADTPSGLRAMLDCAVGWGEALTLLKFYLEYGVAY